MEEDESNSSVWRRSHDLGALYSGYGFCDIETKVGVTPNTALELFQKLIYFKTEGVLRYLIFFFYLLLFFVFVVDGGAVD